MPIEGALIFGAIVTVTGVGLFLGARHLARRALGARLVLAPETPRIGSTLQLTILARPRQEVQLDGIQATLKCCRSYRTGGLELDEMDQRETVGLIGLLASLLESDSRRRLRMRTQRRERVEYDTVVSRTVSLPVGQRLQPGQARQWSLELPVSSDGLPTDPHGNLKIWWALEVRFEIPNFPDALLEQRVQVLGRY